MVETSADCTVLQAVDIPADDDGILISLGDNGCTTITCTFCRKAFRSSQQCKRHVETIHRSKTQKSNEEHEHHCKQCNQSFKSTKLLLVHEKSHRKAQDKQQHQCQTCGTVLKTMAKYRQHQKAHCGSEQNKLPCEKCDAVFKSREGRRVHMILKHSAGQTYRCQECPMIFARKANLRLHMSTHGQRPHVCSVCGKSFARIESLRTHEQRCATGYRGLFCDECGKRFRKQELLDKHVQQGHPEKEHVCGHCGQSFETKRALSHHVRVHEGQHRCSHCTLQFVTVKALQNHERSRHWEILGVERVIGKQGRRKNKPEQPAKSKLRIRRNKHYPFLGLEHLAEQPAEESINLDKQTENERADTSSIPINEEVGKENSDQLHLRDVTSNGSQELLELAQETPELTSTVNFNKTDDNKVDKNDEVKKVSPVPSEYANDESSSSIANENPDYSIESSQSEPPIESEPEYQQPTKRRKRHRIKATVNQEPTKPKPFGCDNCDKSFAHRFWLVSHRQKVHGIQEPNPPQPKKGRTHFCNECEKSFSDWRNLAYHYKHFHKLVFNDDELEKCPSCKKRFIKADELKTHICMRGIFINRQPSFKCELCEKAYHSQHGLDCHRSVHAEFHRFNCDVCQKAFANLKDMNYHKKRVHVEASFVCDVCGKAFKLQTQLTVHAQIHQQLKRHQCEFCGKSFSQRNGMTAHLKIAHAEQLGTVALAEREICCEICGKKLKGKICLKLHMKLHTDERSFACSFCDKKFIVKQDKIRHEQNHTKEYRFKCRFCGKGSTRRKLILLHEARRHNVTDSEELGPGHGCKVCGRTFLTPSALQIHMSLHSNELPVQCTQCDRRFKNVKYMKYHVKAHHQRKIEVQPPPEAVPTVITITNGTESLPENTQQLTQPTGQLDLVQVCNGTLNNVTIMYVQYTVEPQQVKDFLQQNC
ncbi:zinc finger protein 665-like [Wyeomyia smithii]|uniref:zinc finger protein 665-like n=1 Tax=Wyeomyia smithii TaxID=174621 RepID=UPI002467D59C|nr:zinc finger protein 665-like [Wyeomyia smithii]